MPIVLVSLGLGSVLVSLSASPVFPFMKFVLDHKGAAFALVGMLLGFNYYLMYMYLPAKACAPGEVCHIDSRTSRVGRWMLWVSVAIYAVSLFATYLLLPVVLLFER